MEPLLDENTEGCCDESNDKAQKPESIDEHSILRSFKRRRSEVRHSRIDEVPIDSETCDLSRKVDEDLVCEVFRLLLQVLVGFDDECRDNGRE